MTDQQHRVTGVFCPHFVDHGVSPCGHHGDGLAAPGEPAEEILPVLHILRIEAVHFLIGAKVLLQQQGIRQHRRADALRHRLGGLLSPDQGGGDDQVHLGLSHLLRQIPGLCKALFRQRDIRPPADHIPMVPHSLPVAGEIDFHSVCSFQAAYLACTSSILPQVILPSVQ